MLSGLLLALAPPALRRVPVLRPFQVLAGETVPCLQLVVPRGAPLGASGYRSARLLLARHPVLLCGDPVPYPLAGLVPLLRRDFPLDVRERPSKARSSLWPLHPPRLWVFRRELRPLIRLLIALDTLVGGAPPDLDSDIRSSSSQRRDVTSCQYCILLAWAGVL